MNENVYHNILVYQGIPTKLNVIGCEFINQQDNHLQEYFKAAETHRLFDQKTEPRVLELMDIPN